MRPGCRLPCCSCDAVPRSRLNSNGLGLIPRVAVRMDALELLLPRGGFTHWKSWFAGPERPDDLSAGPPGSGAAVGYYVIAVRRLQLTRGPQPRRGPGPFAGRLTV